MADVRINAGIHRRLAKGGLLRITKSESDYAIGYLEPGSTSYQRGGVDKKPVHDEHGEFDGKYTFGNERPSTLRIRMPATDDGLAGEGDICDIVREEVAADGSGVTFDMAIEIPDAPGATSGQRCVFANAVLDTLQWTAGGGAADPDMLEMSFLVADADPTWVEYGA